MKRLLVLWFPMFLVLLISCDNEKSRFENLVHNPNITHIIYNVNIVDVESGGVLPDKTVFISSEKIHSITNSFSIDSIDSTNSKRIIDGTGLYLIPGLWDMHTHSQGAPALKNVQLPLYIAHGITGIREMSGLQHELHVRDSIQAGYIEGPRMVVGSPVMDNFPNKGGTPSFIIENEEAVNQAVDSLKKMGYDFIKTYDFLDKKTYQKLQEVGKSKGLEVTGHIPVAVSIWDAISMNHKTIEHFIGIELGASTNEQELRTNYLNILKDSISKNDTFLNELSKLKFRSWTEPVERIDKDKLDSLYTYMKDNDTWLVPSLFLQNVITNPQLMEGDDGLEFYPKKYRSPMLYRMFYDPNNSLEKLHRHRVENFSEVIKSGVGILAGSDAFGGFPLHRELELYVEQGLSPQESLKTATINPAKYFNKEDSMGTVSEGKYADLVLLEENPLQNIQHIRKINTVFINGKKYDKSSIDDMLKRVKYIVNNME